MNHIRLFQVFFDFHFTHIVTAKHISNTEPSIQINYEIKARTQRTSPGQDLRRCNIKTSLVPVDILT